MLPHDNSEPGEEVFGDDDDNFTVDLGSVPDQVREVIPAGDYNVVVSGCEYKRSQSSNKPMWSVVLEIEDGTYAGRKLYTNMSFSEKALGMTKGIVKILKPELLDSPLNPKAIADNGELLGCKARVRTKVELYQGEKQTKVARFQPATSSANAFV